MAGARLLGKDRRLGSDQRDDQPEEGRLHFRLPVFEASEGRPESTLDDLVAETRQTYAGPLEVGEDLTSFEIGDTVTVHRFKN
jgi:hypothetical protein